MKPVPGLQEKVNTAFESCLSFLWIRLSVVLQLCKQNRNVFPDNAYNQKQNCEHKIHGKSQNPGIVNIKKIAEGLGVTIREFYDSEIFVANIKQFKITMVAYPLGAPPLVKRVYTKTIIPNAAAKIPANTPIFQKSSWGFKAWLSGKGSIFEGICAECRISENHRNFLKN